MSDILIRGMKMPKEGHLIIRIYASGEVCKPTTCAGLWGKVATAVPVPPHGDLIDRDALLQEHERIVDSWGLAHIVSAQAVRTAPAIIPAGDKDTNVLGKEEGE